MVECRKVRAATQVQDTVVRTTAPHLLQDATFQQSVEKPQTQEQSQPNCVQRLTSSMIRHPIYGWISRALIRCVMGFAVGVAYSANTTNPAKACAYARKNTLSRDLNPCVRIVIASVFKKMKGGL